MKAEFTMHISVTERNVVLTTDTNNMQGVDTQLAINIYKAMEGTRGRIKKEIVKFYSNPEGMEQDNGGDSTQVDDNTQE